MQQDVVVKILWTIIHCILPALNIDKIKFLAVNVFIKNVLWKFAYISSQIGILGGRMPHFEVFNLLIIKCLRKFLNFKRL
jgi:hypothetical protein